MNVGLADDELVIVVDVTGQFHCVQSLKRSLSACGGDERWCECAHIEIGKIRIHVDNHFVSDSESNKADRTAMCVEEVQALTRGDCVAVAPSAVRFDAVAGT
ncbi:hypothetical protein ACVIHH_003046 [Bradyrhizobium sp. USDA 4518]